MMGNKELKTEACIFIKTETLPQVFSCEFWETSKNTFFTEHVWSTASGMFLNDLFNLVLGCKYIDELRQEASCASQEDSHLKKRPLITRYQSSLKKNIWSNHQRCSIEKGVLKVSLNSQENTCSRVSFLLKLQAWGIYFQKQSSRSVFKKRCSENKQQIYRRTLMPKCDVIKVAKQLYWNRTLAWMFYCKFAAYFQNTFS